MLYFRFDWEKDFKGAEHRSGLAGWYDTCFDQLADTQEYDELEEKYVYGTAEYDIALDNLIKDFAIENGYLLDGCSCFTLTNEGIEEFVNYIKDHPIDEYPEINIFEGIDRGFGHDGEKVAECTKIIYTGKTKDFMNIIKDDDIEDKVSEVLKLIK